MKFLIKTITKKYLNKKILLVLASLVCIGGIVLAIRDHVFASFTPQPETFTELYLNDNPSLPQQVSSYRLYAFSFTIHNLEGKTINYPYEVYLASSGQKSSIDKKTVTLPNSKSVTINELFSFNSGSASGSAEIVVNLLNKNQQVDFWVKGGK